MYCVQLDAGNTRTEVSTDYFQAALKFNHMTHIALLPLYL